MIPGTASDISHDQNESERLRDAIRDRPIDELRGDLYTLLVLLDVDGQLVIVRVGPGHDTASAADARRRGYKGDIPLSYLQFWFGN